MPNTTPENHDSRPESFFTADQRQRLEELMTRWRAARDGQTSLKPEEQAELDSLVNAEVQAAGQRAAHIVKECCHTS